MPCRLLQGGKVMLPGPDGPIPARTADGQLYDVLDVSDQLAERFGRIYVVDLDGREHDQPQLNYLLEISRSAEIWVDAGGRSGEQAIEIVVAGAYRTVLSSAMLERAGGLEQAWKLSPEISFELEVLGGQVATRARRWVGRTPRELVDGARRAGVADVVLNHREAPANWDPVRQLAPGGPLWVAGSFQTNQLTELRDAGAAGGIFHITEELTTLPPLSGRPEA